MRSFKEAKKIYRQIEIPSRLSQTVEDAIFQATSSIPVSYTHLDVYKRQALDGPQATTPTVTTIFSTAAGSLN